MRPLIDAVKAGRGVVAVGILVLLGLTIACSGTGGSATSSAGGDSDQTNAFAPNPRSTSGATPSTSAPAADKHVTFRSGDAEVRGSLRVPATATTDHPVPGVLVLAGSGPTDRDGNSPAISGTVGNLAWLAGQLADDGAASLRYDKLGSGETGLSSYASHPGDVDFDLFVQEARDGLAYLASQPGVDPNRLVVAGHSEGGLIALALATNPGNAPSPRGLMLLSPLSERYLDTIVDQVRDQAAAAQASGSMTAAQARAFVDEVRQVVNAVRAGSPLPSNLPPTLTNLFNPSAITFLRQADQNDPTALAKRLGPPQTVLLSCGTKDVQVPCDKVAALQADFPAGVATLVRLDGADHVFKAVGERTSDGTEYGQPLPFSPDLAAAVQQYVAGLG